MHLTACATVCLIGLPMVSASAGAAERQMLTGHVPQAVAASQVLHELASSTRLNLAIGLPLRNQDKLDVLLAQLSDPASSNFGHYLTPVQFAEQFGPTEQDYQALAQFAVESGLIVTGTHPNRMLLDVSGTAAEIANCFHVKMMVYRHPVRGEFYAPDREPSLDLATKTLDISGLDNYVLPQPMSLKTLPFNQEKPYVTGSGPGGYFIGKDFRAAYAPGVTLTGSNQVVGLLEFDGFFAGDVQKNAAQANLPPVPTQTVLLDGFNGSAGSSNIEVILDIMMASYMAPGLSKIIVYEGSVPNDILNRMATDNLAQQLSSSWGYGPINATTEQIFKQYIAQGQSILQASGDSGAYKNGVMQPSDDPNLTVVGGTSLTTAGAGGSWQSETTWSGSGGGVSTVYPIPSYQQSISMTANGGSTKMRNIPDVALTADIQMFLIQSNGQACVVGGTSAAAPLWAGFIALANQQAAASAKSRVGFLNPLLYAIGNSGNFASDLNDIRSGNDNGFSAVTGYDLATGWGSPAGQHFIYDLTGTSGAPSFTLSSSASTLTIPQASTASATLTVAAKNGFNSNVSLAVTGLPSGVTAVLNPAMTATSSSIAFTVSSLAAAGTYNITITGISGTLSSTTTIALTVVAPSFSLSATPAALTLATPSSANTTIGVTGQNGFAGTVVLTATGLPTGVTAVFGTGTSTRSLTFTASSTATPGTYTVTVAGVSGTLKASTAVTLTVVAPSFSLTASPSSLTLPRSAGASTTIAVTGQNGFSAAVVLAATALPTGVTAVFGSGTGTRSVTFTASSTAVAGSYTVTVSGTSGTLKASTTVALTVTAPSFTLAFLPATLALPRGFTSAGSTVVTAQNGFASVVTLSLTGIPAGVTASIGASSATGVSSLSFTASSTATAGSFPITVKGVSGSLTNSASFTLTVLAPATGTSLVNLSPSYNINALVADGAPFTGGGLDGGLNGSSTAYSANLIGAQQTIAGTLFFFGPANALDAVSAKTIALPSGQFSGLKLLATGVNGNQLAQVFKVTYTDGTTSTFTQNLSDWFGPQSYSGETKALTLPYRDNGQGQTDNRTFYLYEYAFALTSTKTVSSITLPNNRNVVVLAATMTGVTASVKAK